MKKSMLKKAVAFFLLGLVVMQALFTGDSKEASAHHSDNASLKYIQGMRIYAKTTKAFTNLPAPYNTSTHSALSAIAIKDASKKNYDLSYCIGYDKAASNSDKLSSKTSDTSCIMTMEQARLINYAIMLGYNKETININNKNTTETNEYFATQALVWIIKDGFFDKDTQRKQIEEVFFKRYPGIKSYYQSLYAKVTEQIKQPSFVDGKNNLMTLNKCTKKYELTLTNTNVNAMKNVKVVACSVPADVTATISGESLVITTTKEITTPFTIKLSKNIDKKGRVVAWKNNTGDKQPQATIDYDLEAIEQTFEINAYTPASEVQPTDSVCTPVPTVQPTDSVCTPVPTVQPTDSVCTPVPTVQPTDSVCTLVPTVQPTDSICTPDPTVLVQNPDADNDKFEVKVVNSAETNETRDDSPKTADESNITFVYKLLGASVFMMVGVVVVTLINKRRERY